MANTIMNTYGRMDIAFSHGKGALLWDQQGNEYLDALCGIAVTGLGHAHPSLSKALCDQAEKLLHTSNLYRIPAQQQLADKLTRISNMDAVFFSNSGAEANEAAIKIARKYGHDQGIDNPMIIVMENSFHGRTLATLSATGNRKVQAGFEPLVSGFLRVPFNDLDAIHTIARNNTDVVAILVEPVQGEGGVRIPDQGYLQQLRQICNQQKWLLMLDEVQTGMGRTGKWFAFMHENITPDVMTLAKSLGNGVPIGACLAKGDAAQVLTPGTHGSTFGGNPLACAAANAVIDTIEQQQLFKQAEKLGKQIVTELEQGLQGNQAVVAIRHKGLMIAIELDRPCAELVTLACQQGLLINVTAEKVIRLLPPLILSEQQATELSSKLLKIIGDWL